MMLFFFVLTMGEGFLKINEASELKASSGRSILQGHLWTASESGTPGAAEQGHRTSIQGPTAILMQSNGRRPFGSGHCHLSRVACPPEPAFYLGETLNIKRDPTSPDK